MTRLLHDVVARPYAFGALDASPSEVEGVAPAELAAFVPFEPDAPPADEASIFRPFAPPPVPEPDPEPEMDPAAFEAGRQAGHDARDDEVTALRAEVEELRAALEACRGGSEKRAAFAERTADQLHDAWARACKEMEAPLVALAVETAEAVLDAPLSAEQRAASEAGLAAALDTLAETAPLTIALHPVDLLHLQETGLADALETTHPGLRWASDTALAEGDWTVTAAEAAVRRVRGDMIAALRGRLHLDAA